jgi:uroporphyrinogen-III synthase
MSALEGCRVALLEARLTEEAAACVRRYGGTPICVPALREVRHVDRARLFLDRLSAGRIDVAVFLTGTGATVLLDEAARLGRLHELLLSLRRTIVACRGPKPVAVLKRHDVAVEVTASEPYTSAQLLDALSQVQLHGKSVALVRDGDRGSARARLLTAALSAAGASLEEFELYEWALPLDLEPVRELVRALTDRRLEAVAFSNSIQWRHLFLLAENLGVTKALVDALNGDVIVAAVGPVCAESLQAAGVTPDVIPARPTLESMIAALADYVELTRDVPD